MQLHLIDDPIFRIHLTKMEKFCVYQERCLYDVQQKLIKLSVDKSMQQAIIDHLVKGGFINEERFTELFVRSKKNQKGWGPQKIRVELARRKISKALIDAYCSLQPSDDDQTRLKDLLLKKLRQLNRETPDKLYVKLVRFGLSKGFALSDVTQLVRKMTGSHSMDNESMY